MVSIDTVYQRVLVLANKEQRGYITPQEFNLLANQAQMEIFEQYFADLVVYNKNPGNTQEFADPLSVLYEKIGIFDIDQNNNWMNANMSGSPDMFIPRDQIYKVGTVRVGNNQVELVSGKDFNAAQRSFLTAPSITRPIGTINALGLRVAIGSNIFATPSLGINMSISYTMRPPDVQWAYVIVNDKALYNSNISVNFELHASEETELVYKILKLAGLNLKATEIVQGAAGLEQANKQTTL
jgi:hypothetical protein